MSRTKCLLIDLTCASHHWVALIYSLQCFVAVFWPFHFSRLHRQLCSHMYMWLSSDEKVCGFRIQV